MSDIDDKLNALKQKLNVIKKEKDEVKKRLNTGPGVPTSRFPYGGGKRYVDKEDKGPPRDRPLPDRWTDSMDRPNLMDRIEYGGAPLRSNRTNADLRPDMPVRAVVSSVRMVKAGGAEPEPAADPAAGAGMGDQEQGGGREAEEEGAIVPPGPPASDSNALDARSRKRGAERPAAALADGEAKRARRMFGAILGTLQRAKKESDAEKGVQARREARLKELEEREAQRLAALRAQEAQDRRRRADEDRAAVGQLSLEERITALEVRALEEIRKEERLVSYLKTATTPAIYYLPAKLGSPLTRRLLEERRAAFEAWRAARLAELEAEKERMVREREDRMREVRAMKAAAGEAGEEESGGMQVDNVPPPAPVDDREEGERDAVPGEGPGRAGSEEEEGEAPRGRDGRPRSPSPGRGATGGEDEDQATGGRGPGAAVAAAVVEADKEEEGEWTAARVVEERRAREAAALRKVEEEMGEDDD